MISNPIKGYKNAKYPLGNVTQWYGENPALYSKIGLGLSSHNGIDIVSQWGTPIYAVEGGLVCEVNDNPEGYGKHVRILSDKYEWTYGHLSFIKVKVGQQIKVGECIGQMGNTGFVVSSASANALGYWSNGGNNYNGTHLHLTCLEYKLDIRGWSYYPNTPKMVILNYDNGNLGSIDFKDMFMEGINGDIEILKRELEKTPEDEWWMKMIKALRFFGH